MKKATLKTPSYTYLKERRRPDGTTVTDQLECEMPSDADGTDGWAPQHTHKGETPDFIDSHKV